MVPPDSAYQALGVSASKEEVHEAIRRTDPGLFPGAFCRIAEDVLGGDPDWCCAMHADDVGTKAVVAYLLFREHGDAGVFRGLAQDSVVMNLDDLLCIGAADRFLMANTIARNSLVVPGEAIREIIEGYETFRKGLAPYGVEIAATGGETGDLVDCVRTLVVGSMLAARLPRGRVVDNRRIAPGDVIVGLASDGQARYEDRANSGIGSNGLTLARHVLLLSRYAEQYPETVEPRLPRHLVYRGPFSLADEPPGLGMTVGQALVSPTRTYAPIIRTVLAELGDQVHGIVHNTGGGLTKSKRFGEGIAYYKDHLFPAPPLFRLIARTGELSRHEMCQTFNMGHRMELMVPPAPARRVIAISQAHGVSAQVVGHCERAQDNAVYVVSEGECLRY